MGAKEENDPKATEEKRNEIFIAALGRSYLKEDHEGVSGPLLQPCAVSVLTLLTIHHLLIVTASHSTRYVSGRFSILGAFTISSS